MNVRAIRLLSSLAAVVAIGLGSARAGVVTVDFDDLSLSPNSAFQGPMPNADEIAGPWGPEMEGTFTSGGASFINRYNTTYGSWSGFAYSNQTNTTEPGYLNQFSVFTGEARSGDNFGVSFGYHDLEANGTGNEPFNPLNIDHLRGLSSLTLPDQAAIEGMYVTNTTYTALSLRDGDGFADKLGGADGLRADWFKMTAYGSDAYGNVLTDALGAALSVDFFLADNRAGQMFIANQWMYMDLSALAAASQIHFNMSGSAGLTGGYGLNTPAFFAVDDITYNLGAAAVPEPASLAMAGVAVVLVGLGARRRPRA